MRAEYAVALTSNETLCNTKCAIKVKVTWKNRFLAVAVSSPTRDVPKPRIQRRSATMPLEEQAAADTDGGSCWHAAPDVRAYRADSGGDCVTS